LVILLEMPMAERLLAAALADARAPAAFQAA